MTSRSAVLNGSRRAARPRYLSAPPAVSSSGAEAVELAASAGLVLDPWQAADLTIALGERADGRWAAFEVGLIVGRQNGKGGILEARQLAGLFLLGERLQTHTAHRVDTCLEHFRRVKQLITDTPDLSRQVRKITEKNGAEAIELHTGQRLIFKARSKGAGRGFSGSAVYLDEAFYLYDLGSMLPTMSAQPNPQLWYTSSAPLERAESTILRNLCKRGRLGKSPSLAYMEYAAHPDAESGDRQAWADANPALGLRIREEFILQEMEALDPVEFRRERLGLWVDPSDGALEAKVITLDEWDACEDAASKMATTPTFAFDVSPDRSSSAICAAGQRADGLSHVEVTGNGDVMDNRAGTGWVVPRLVEIVKRQGGTIACDPTGPAGALLPDLRRALQEADVTTTVTELKLDQHKQAVGNFYDATMGGVLRHLGQPMLRAALRGADKRPVGDAWLWSRQKSAVDITPLVAATVAMWAAANVAAESEPFVITT